jgi:hypothetical protein
MLKKLTVLAWFHAFLFTQVVECPIYFFALRRAQPSKRVRVAIAFGASALTHPIVWFVIPPVIYKSAPMLHGWALFGTSAAWVLMAVVAETFAVAAEAYYLAQFKVLRPWRWALAANAASVVLGLLSRSLFGAP